MKKFLSVLTIIAVVFMSAVPVFADYTAVAGPAIVGMQTTMDVEDGATVPATTVAYSIAAGAAVTPDAYVANTSLDSDGVYYYLLIYIEEKNIYGKEEPGASRK